MDDQQFEQRIAAARDWPYGIDTAVPWLPYEQLKDDRDVWARVTARFVADGDLSSAQWSARQFALLDVECVRVALAREAEYARRLAEVESLAVAS